MRKDLNINLRLYLNKIFSKDNPYQVEIERFRNEYPAWTNFLQCNFPLAEFDFTSEEDLINATLSTDDISILSKESDIIASLSNFPWHAISEYSQTTFDNEEDTRRWFLHLLSLIDTKESSS